MRHLSGEYCALNVCVCVLILLHTLPCTKRCAQADVSSFEASDSSEHSLLRFSFCSWSKSLLGRPKSRCLVRGSLERPRDLQWLWQNCCGRQGRHKETLSSWLEFRINCSEGFWAHRPFFDLLAHSYKFTCLRHFAQACCSRGPGCSQFSSLSPVLNTSLLSCFSFCTSTGTLNPLRTMKCLMDLPWLMDYSSTLPRSRVPYT